MSEVLVGPMLRYVGRTEATVWVETDIPCEVSVVVGGESHRSRTFRVGGHHYALVVVRGLEPGSRNAYEVLLDGEGRWPEAGSPFPPCVIRTPGDGESVKIVFGSCRISAPHEKPYTLHSDADERGLAVDALFATAMRLRDEPPEALPHALVMLGDQVYAHKPPFDTLEFIRSRRDTDEPPGEAVSDFEEYARIYRDSWGDPAIRWLLSTVSTSMIFDDHEVDDDWNISESWVEEMRLNPWWNGMIIGGYASYWVYQHLGNLSPETLAKDDLYRTVTASDDAWPVLRDFASSTHRKPEGHRWSFHRDFGGVRLVMMDSRGGRILTEGSRSMVDGEELGWIEAHATGGFDHLVLGTSVPLMLSPGMHHLQSWTEALCAGAWGKRAANRAEGVRRSQDLDHWASFHRSFTRITDLIRDVASGERGNAPASVVVISGDVHHGYLAEAAFKDSAVSRVYQAVSSPLRNSLPGRKSRLQRAGWTARWKLIGRVLARLAGVEKESLDWHLTHDGPWFDNQVATLEMEGRSARIVFERAVHDASGEPTLEKLHARDLA